MDIYRNQERELKLAKKPLIVLEDELWQINQLSSCLLYTSPSPRD